MKKFPFVPALCFSLVCAVGIECYRVHKEKARESAEWKKIGDSMGNTMQETIRTLEEMPNVGK